MSKHESLTKRKITQTENIVNHLRKKGSITPLKAWEAYGCYRLSSVINRLRKKGLQIITEIIRRKDSIHAKYKLIK